MPVYLDFQYLGGFYEGAPASLAGIPQDIQFYRTTTDNVYVFHWEFTEDTYVPGVERYTFELQLDEVSTFNSVNLQTFGLNVVAETTLDGRSADIFGAQTIGDSSLALTPNDLVGHVVIIDSGTGAGQFQRVASHTATTFTVEFPWVTPPDGTSVFSVYRSNVRKFQNGNVAKGYEIEVPSRQLNPEKELFMRVRTLSGSTPLASYSNIGSFTLLNRYDLSTAETLITSLPDFHIYNKEVLKLPEQDRDTLLWKVMLMYGEEADRTQLLRVLTSTDNYITLTRDEKLFDNFGTFFGFRKPSSMQFVDYRRCLQSLVDGALHGGTVRAAIRLLECFTGAEPTVQAVREVADFFLNTIEEKFAGDGATTEFQFTESATFVGGTTVVVQEGSVEATLEEGVDYEELPTLPGIEMNTAPDLGDTLTVFYAIALPEPLVFDPGDIYTELEVPPPTSWDTSTLAFGILVEIQNPAGFTLDEDLIEFLLRQVLPAHTKLLLTFN